MFAALVVVLLAERGLHRLPADGERCLYAVIYGAGGRR
jgi:hypothetical protein